MLSIPPRQYLDFALRAEAATHRMSPLHITDLTLGLRLARRRGAGSTHAAIYDTAIALVPRIRAVVVGKGVRGAPVHWVRISNTLCRDTALGKGRSRIISRDSQSARIRRQRGRTRTGKVRRRRVLGRWEHPIRGYSRRRRLPGGMQSRHARELRRKMISFAVFVKRGARKTCLYYSQSPLCPGKSR